MIKQFVLAAVAVASLASTVSAGEHIKYTSEGQTSDSCRHVATNDLTILDNGRLHYSPSGHFAGKSFKDIVARCTLDFIYLINDDSFGFIPEYTEISHYNDITKKVQTQRRQTGSRPFSEAEERKVVKQFKYYFERGAARSLKGKHSDYITIPHHTTVFYNDVAHRR